jgi:plastocyanin
MQTATPHAARRNAVRARRLCALGAVALAVLTACGSSSLSRRVAFVESNGETRFDTSSITVTKGDTLKLTVINRTPARQVFAVDALNVQRSVAPDTAVTVDIPAKRSGTYRVSSPRIGVDPLSIVVPN